MFFSRKKKLLQDRNAGLVFQWRGGNAGNKGGMSMAFLLAGLIFAVIFASFSIIAKSKQPAPRYTANVTLLGEVDEKMTWWIEKNSPYQSHWYEEVDDLGEDSVADKLSALLDSQSEPSLGWRKMNPSPSKPEIPSFYSNYEVELPQLSRLIVPEDEEMKSAKTLDPNWVVLKVRSLDANHKARIPDEMTFKAKLNKSNDRLGETLSFMVTLNASGDVLNAIPVEWSDEEMWKDLENWVNGLHFKPTSKKDNPDGMVQTILIEVNVEAVLLEAKEEKP